ncbi:AzlC family ABC transporter permease [Pseudovibrio exalbescens]|uniref:AzlC family ABC transporter permease n=1 Tax=Pseudovibrio exalbescens TaxID=197461 RepID=UPI000C9A70AC|nr:AzlC family ABC transporter permease [Pseudovibrio exalbescens]
MVLEQSDFSEARKGFIEITPLAVGVGFYGLAFGLLAAQAGLSSLEVGFMGTFVFAGSAQIVAVERLMAGAGAAAAIIAGLALNLRLLLITASVSNVFAQRPLWQLVLGLHLTTDENWAMMLARQKRGGASGYWYLVGGGMALLLIWLVSTVAGVVVATSIPSPKALGLDFAFTAAFIAIARSLWRGPQDLLPWLCVVAVVVLGLYSGVLSETWVLIIAALAGTTVAGVRR